MQLLQADGARREYMLEQAEGEGGKERRDMTLSQLVKVVRPKEKEKEKGRQINGVEMISTVSAGSCGRRFRPPRLQGGLMVPITSGQNSLRFLARLGRRIPQLLQPMPLTAACLPAS